MKDRYLIHRELPEEVFERKYGIPELKKYPMPDSAHVRSAIRFFNYVEPRYEEELAKAILNRMKEYGLTFDDFTVGEENRFFKYIPQKSLSHHGIAGQKWGKQNGPPYPLDYEDHSAAEKKLNPKGLLNNYSSPRSGSSGKRGFKEKVFSGVPSVKSHGTSKNSSSSKTSSSSSSKVSNSGSSGTSRTSVKDVNDHFNFDLSKRTFKYAYNDENGELHTETLNMKDDFSIWAEEVKKWLDEEGPEATIDYLQNDMDFTEEEARNIVENLNDALDSLKSDEEESDEKKTIDEIQDIVDKVWNGDFGVGDERRKKLESMGYSYKDIQGLVDKGYGYKVTSDDLTSSMKQSVSHSDFGDKRYLIHHGIKGQKWGVRRYQNSDGSLTAEGKKRYSTGSLKSEKEFVSRYPGLDKQNYDNDGASNKVYVTQKFADTCKQMSKDLDNIGIDIDGGVYPDGSISKDVHDHYRNKYDKTYKLASPKEYEKSAFKKRYQDFMNEWNHEQCRAIAKDLGYADTSKIANSIELYQQYNGLHDFPEVEIVIRDDKKLSHHGIDGQKWGQRNGPPYPLDYADHSAEEKKALKKDLKWIKKNEKKIHDKAYKESKKEIKEYSRLLSMKYGLNKNGKLSAAYVNNFNRGMAELMTDKVSDLTSPSGRAVKFIAKRGEMGVYTALADQGYDMSQVKNGVWTSGRIAYKKTGVSKVDVSDY